MCDESVGGCDTLLSCQRWRLYGIVWDGFVVFSKMHDDGWKRADFLMGVSLDRAWNTLDILIDGRYAAGIIRRLRVGSCRALE